MSSNLQDDPESELEDEEKEEDEEEEDEFLRQLKYEQLEKLNKAEASELSRGLSYTDDDGTVMEWDAERKAYFPKIDADFIAQYQCNYGASQASQEDWEALSEEEKKRRYDEYWSSYYQAYSKEQPPMPVLDVEGNEVAQEDGAEAGKKDKKKEGEKKEGDEKEDKDKDPESAGGQPQWDPVSDEAYQYNLYYYGQEYADEYKSYYIDHPDEAAMPDWYSQRAANLEADNKKKVDKGKKKDKDKAEKRKEPPREEGWFEVDQTASTQVYVSGLPDDFTQEEFQDLMAKCGLVMFDPHTHKPKAKLYKDTEGRVKGDGLCTYIKAESVELALNILDGSDVKGKKIKVEKAKFELKGNFDPKKKKKKLSNKAKQKLKEKQQKLFDWRPDKNPFERSKNERIVILKNMFDISEFDKDPTLINELRNDVREECVKFGEVKKVMLYDRNPEGVISVSFKEAEDADKCIAALNGRWFAKKKISAACHDGKTKYDIQETDEERAKRIADWNAYLAGEEKKEENKKETDDKKSVTESEKNSVEVSESKDDVSAKVAGKGGGSTVMVEDVEEPDGIDTGASSEPR